MGFDVRIYIYTVLKDTNTDKEERMCDKMSLNKKSVCALGLALGLMSSPVMPILAEDQAPVTSEEAVKGVELKGKTYSTVQEAVNTLKTGDNVVIEVTKDQTMPVMIPKGVEVTLNIAKDVKWTNEGVEKPVAWDSSVIVNEGKVIINNKGTLENVIKNLPEAIVQNNTSGECIINGGMYLIDCETRGINATPYGIRNMGIMAINDNAIVYKKSGRNMNSLVVNGYFDAEKAIAEKAPQAMLTINKATVKGKAGIEKGIGVKSDDYAKTIINDILIENMPSSPIQTADEMIINGGTIKSRSYAITHYGIKEYSYVKGKITINGGSFYSESPDAKLFRYCNGDGAIIEQPEIDKDNIEIKGGTFYDNLTNELKDYLPKDITLLPAKSEIDGRYTAGKVVKVDGEVTLYTGNEGIYTLETEGEDLDYSKIEWTTDKEGVVELGKKENNTIVLQGLAEGKVVLTGKLGDQSKTLEINVTKEPTKINVENEEETIIAGKTKELIYAVTPVDKANAEVNWTSSNDKVVKVVDGKIDGIKEGFATLTGTLKEDPNVKAVVKVKVLAKPTIKVLKVNRTQEIVNVNGLKDLTYQLDEQYKGLSVKWKSLNPEVVKVNDDGELEGMKAGVANVEVYLADYPKVKQQIQIVVIPEEAEELPSLDLGSDKVIVSKGEPADLEYGVPAGYENAKINWIIEDPDIAKVDGDRITGLKAGTTKLTGYYIDYPGVQQVVDLVVEDVKTPTKNNKDKNVDTGAENGILPVIATFIATGGILGGILFSFKKKNKK